jgi:hypothetical protein
MTCASDKDNDFSTGIKSGGKRCFKCDGPVYFISKEAETPSGKPTKNPSTGKVIPLDPSTHEYHECKPEDVETYRETDEYKKRISEWISKQGSTQNIGNTSITKNTEVISSSHDTTSNNNSDNNLTLGKILSSIDHTNAFLEQMHTDFKVEIDDIKNQLKISTSEHLNEDKKLKMEEK